MPLDKWMREELKEMLVDYSNAEFLKKQEIFNPLKTQEMINGYLNNGDKGHGTGENMSKICWSFLIFQQWYDYYIR